MIPQLQSFLIGSGLVSYGSPVMCTPLSGGVSCDVWRVDAGARSLCVKRALPRLRVEALWEAPISRNAHEWAWLNFAARAVPDSVPRPLAHDPQSAMFAMEFLEPERFPIWKQRLLDGHANAGEAASVASILVRLHAASAGNDEVSAAFRTRETFFALRIDPYLLEAARRNPRVADPLLRIAEQTLTNEIALVHGDVSPKNILMGADGPVFLDAETAWYGDPAFDLAFCLNHLLLKCLARPAFAASYLGCFAAFRSAYLPSVTWENISGLERRAAQLLPALLLARADGKSPVEYLQEPDRAFVRETACAWLVEVPERLDTIAELWRTALTRREQPPR